LISELVSYYRVIDKLGAGGMGEVYLAEDTRLGRRVALKVLPASYQYDPDRRDRFLREARAASALRSPNIAAIYDIGEHQGSQFIVMEYVEGELLSRRIDRGPLPLAEAVGVAIQVGDALDEAHNLGIIHRDIKSANLMITGRDLVKVLDFGLAKIIKTGREDETGLTTPLGQQTIQGLVLGTVSYMSPEQARGQEVDTRTDIFSLGVVIYEMVTARLPFVGGSSMDTIDRILHEEPVAVARFNYNVPAELERILRKCLEKDRERRYTSTRELVTDLRNLQRDSQSGAVMAIDAGRPAQPPRKTRPRKAIDSLAIMPFANGGADPDTEYLSDGITETIIHNLSQLPKLRVMARSTVFRYKGASLDPLEVGPNLGVRAVLMGRVLHRGDSLVIKVELVDALDGAHLWGENYNRRLSDIFAIEEEISREISEKLRLRLSGEQKRRLQKRHTENTEAYQLYLKGRYWWNKRTEEALRKGIEYFEKAIEADPSYALAYAGMADSYNMLVSYSMVAPNDAFPKAKASATRALEIDNALAEAHASLGLVKLGYDWDWPGADRSYKRAIELNPGYGLAHLWYAVFLIAMERVGEAIREIAQAQDLDPLSLPITTNAGWILHLARRYDDAISTYEKALDLDSNFALAHRRLGQTYVEQRRYAEALSEFEKARELSGMDAETLASLGHVYGLSGKTAEAEGVIEQLLAASAKRYIPSYLIAKVYIGLGDTDRAFEWLDKAFEERYGFLAYLKVEPLLDNLK
jgi:serine/threonine protein kinase/Tfp pilus assembly protein PilF